LLTVFSITSSIFIIIALGFITVRRGLLEASNTRALGIFVVDYALPALLFNALSQQPTQKLLNVDLLFAYALGSLSLLAMGIMFRCFVQRKGLQEATILTMGMTISNSAFMGFPIAEQIIHETARATLAVYVSVENLIMLPLLLTLAELSGQTKTSHFSILKGIIKRLITNPLIISISAGVLFSMFELHLPKPISHALTMLSGASAPVALFYIGCTLAGLKLKGMGSDISSIIFGKLILHPLAIYVTLLVLSFNNPMLKQAAVINASMPMFSIYPLISQKYGYEDLCAAAMVATTVISFFTITALLWIIQSGYLN
jgi:predicted permease